MIGVSNDKGKFYEEVYSAVETIASTYGYYGHNVMIYNTQGLPLITKDGAMVATNIEGVGAKIVCEGSLATYSAAGDGTTTCAVLIGAMVKNGLAAIGQGMNPFDYINHLSVLVDEVVGALDIIEVTTEEQMVQVGTIASNNNAEMGELVGRMAFDLGKYGSAQFDEAPGNETSISIIKEGYSFDGKPFDSELNASLQISEPLIFLSADKIDLIEQITPMWNRFWTKKHYDGGTLKSLVIVAPEVTGSVIGSLRAAVQGYRNHHGGIPFEIVCVKAPSIDHINDLAFLTDTRVYGVRYGLPMKDFKGDFGKARRVRVNALGTLVFYHPSSAIEDYVKGIDDEVRLAKLKAGVGLIKVGGLTTVERNNNRLQLDDAYKTCFAAINDGIICGGGYALHKAGNGHPIFSAPLMQLLKNASSDPKRVLPIFEDSGKVLDLKSQKFVDFTEAGLYDSVRATIAAVKNALSATSQILSINYIITK